MPLLLLFIAIPLIEIALFIQLGSILDLGWILLIVVVTAIIGTVLVRRQGRSVLDQIRGSFEQLRDPTEPLAHGAMILFAGALLLTPGFFTDTVGFLLLIPAFRKVVMTWLSARIAVRSTVYGQTRTTRSGPAPHPRGTGAPHTIDGEYRDVTHPSPDQPARNDRPRKPSGWTES